MESSSGDSTFRAVPVVGPPNPARTTRKRVSRACDECRLHKSRCDGSASCATCSQTGRVCSYSLLPSDTKGPNAKIKFLEQRLSRAQQLIQDLQRHGSEDTTTILRTYTRQGHGVDVTSTAGNSVVTARPSVDASPVNVRGKNALKPTLVQSLLRLISDNKNIGSLLKSATANSILSGPTTTQVNAYPAFCQLVPYPTMLEIVYAAFSNTFALYTLVQEQDFRICTQRLYDANPMMYQPDDTAFMPLYFAVIAIGMAYSTDLHPDLDYHHVLKESESYSRAAMAVVPVEHEYDSLIQLQVAVCRVLYLLNTSRVNLANSTLRLVCRSSMVQQLIHNVAVTHDPDLSDLADMSSRDIVWTIFYLDMHISGLQNVSPSLPRPGPELTTVYAINTATYNAANFRRSESGFLLSVSVAMAIELMKLTDSIRFDLENPKVPSGQQSLKGKAVVQDSINRAEVRTQFETWELLLQTAFADDDCNPTLLMVRRQLQMHFYLAKITLHHHALGMRSQPVPWHHVPPDDEFDEESACIKAAVDAIEYTSSHLEQEEARTIPWHSAYVMFISTVTLLTAASFLDHSDRLSFQGTINTATLVLSNTTYGSWHAKSCYIQFTQTLFNIINESVLKSPPSNSNSFSQGSTLVPASTRRSSFSSDASTLVAPSEVRRQRTTNNYENTGWASQWGFD